MLAGSPAALSQSIIWATPNVPLPSFPPVSGTVQPVAVAQPCARPAEMFDIDEYDGPLSRLVAGFSQKMEVKTVAPARPRRHARPCALSAGEKFHLFVENSFEPVNFVGAAWDAAWAQRDNDDPSFHQGASGYGKRYATEVADDIQGDFFNTFLYPSMFRQDPRYYRLGRGPASHRLFHALRHVFVAHSDSGNLMFNYSEWLGTASAKEISNFYHPGNERDIQALARRTGWSISTDMGWDIMREFWPEVAHKFHLPFRTN